MLYAAHILLGHQSGRAKYALAHWPRHTGVPRYNGVSWPCSATDVAEQIMRYHTGHNTPVYLSTTVYRGLARPPMWPSKLCATILATIRRCTLVHRCIMAINYSVAKLARATWLYCTFVASAQLLVVAYRLWCAWHLHISLANAKGMRPSTPQIVYSYWSRQHCVEPAVPSYFA